MVIKGKYFHITSKATGHVLGINGGRAVPGTNVITWTKDGQPNQEWFVDPVSGTVRSKANPSLCLTMNGNNRLIVDNHRPGDSNQTWLSNKHRETFDNRSNGNKVFDIVGANTNKGAEVCAWDYHGQANQQWRLEPLPKRYFFIRSDLSGKVLDVEGGNARTGAKVITWGKKGGNADNQLWFEDIFGNLRSKLNEEVVLDASDGLLRLGTYDSGRPKTYWSIQGNKIVNVHNPNEVLDIKGNNAGDGAEICPWNYKSSSNQHWHFDYIN